MSFNAACRRLCAAKVYPHRYRGGAVKKCMNNTDITPPPVISTAAGQPPIGKPLIVQARGQLRLTWRLYAESPQSGEISLSRGMRQAGDLSTQRLNSPRVFTLLYRHVPPLEMTVAAGSIRSFQKGKWQKRRTVPVISTEVGQPPIGKPLIVQARGQLRLTWRLYAESPQSGEISPL